MHPYLRADALAEQAGEGNPSSVVKIVKAQLWLC